MPVIFSNKTVNKTPNFAASQTSRDLVVRRPAAKWMEALKTIDQSRPQLKSNKERITCIFIGSHISGCQKCALPDEPQVNQFVTHTKFKRTGLKWLANLLVATSEVSSTMWELLECQNQTILDLHAKYCRMNQNIVASQAITFGRFLSGWKYINSVALMDSPKCRKWDYFAFVDFHAFVNFLSSK